MKQFVFISGNEQKVAYVRKWLGHPVEHHKLDLDELQSLDLHEVAEHKVRQAYAIMQKPVVVEDVSFACEALGRLPGPLIKWFLQELQPAGIAKLVNGMQGSHRATASIVYAYFDGQELRTFEGVVPGSIPEEPRFSDASGWKNINNSWNSIFVPEGATKTYGEMTDDELRPLSHRAQALEKLRAFLDE